MMIRRIICLIFILFNVIIPILGQCKPSITKIGGSLANQRTVCSGELILSEEFDYLNQNIWNHELTVNGNGNGEFQEYVNDRSVSFTENGRLVIQPKVVGDVPMKDGFFNPVQSARMNTQGRFTFTYGILEARAKLPAGDWLWPAIWLLAEDRNYGGYPHSGEIDLMESRGNKNLHAWNQDIGTQQTASTVHFGQNYDLVNLASLANNPVGFDNDFHLFRLTWTTDFIAFSVDGTEIGRVTPSAGGFYELGHLSGPNPFVGGGKMAPFDRDFYILLNVAVGGTGGYFPDNCSNPGGKPWQNGSPQASRDFWNGNWQWRPTWNEGTRQSAMEVDYIRVWAL